MITLPFRVCLSVCTSHSLLCMHVRLCHFNISLWHVGHQKRFCSCLIFMMTSVAIWCRGWLQLCRFCGLVFAVAKVWATTTSTYLKLKVSTEQLCKLPILQHQQAWHSNGGISLPGKGLVLFCGVYCKLCPSHCIFSGLVVYSDGPLDTSKAVNELPTFFRAYKPLLARIK